MLIPIILTLFSLLKRHAISVEATPPDSDRKNDIGEPKSSADRHIRAIFIAHAPFMSPVQISVSTTAFESPIFIPGAMAVRLLAKILSN